MMRLFIHGRQSTILSYDCNDCVKIGMVKLVRGLIALILLYINAFSCVHSAVQVAARKCFERAASITLAAICLGRCPAVSADVGQNDIMCIVTVKNSATVPSGTDPAIYLTAREDVGIWTAQIKNVKPPPILTSRTAGPFSFPGKIILSGENDMTPEGQLIAKQWQSGKKPIVVSARLDADGVAATRNAEDLVGKSIATRNDEGVWKDCQIELSDRGVGGKFITKKRQSPLPNELWIFYGMERNLCVPRNLFRTVVLFVIK